MLVVISPLDSIEGAAANDFVGFIFVSRSSFDVSQFGASKRPLASVCRPGTSRFEPGVLLCLAHLFSPSKCGYAVPNNWHDRIDTSMSFGCNHSCAISI